MRDLGLQHQRPVSLCDALDRVLHTGVVALGEVTISVADIDLLYLGLQLVISSIETGQEPGGAGDERPKPGRVLRGGAQPQWGAAGGAYPDTTPGVRPSPGAAATARAGAPQVLDHCAGCGRRCARGRAHSP